MFSPGISDEIKMQNPVINRFELMADNIILSGRALYLSKLLWYFELLTIYLFFALPDDFVFTRAFQILGIFLVHFENEGR